MTVDRQALQAPYGDVSPLFKGSPVYAAEGAVVLGRATLGGAAWLGAWSVIRADGHYVDIGEDFHLGKHATVHIAHEVYPTHIGNRVTAGNGAVIHACIVGDGCVVERDAIILDGSTIGPGAVISAGSVVFPRSDLPGGWLYSGNPAKPISPLTTSELEAYHQKTRNTGSKTEIADDSPQTSLDCFVAPTARVSGAVTVGKGVGIWYGCRLNAGRHNIIVGEGTNIQDNTILVAEESDILIGPEVTIGHNVSLCDCVVETRSLIGIGALIAPGTHVESDVLVAAGTQTEPGQRLTTGQVWAGRPARPIGQMDDRKRRMLSQTLPTYRDYADHFRATPHKALIQVGED